MRILEIFCWITTVVVHLFLVHIVLVIWCFEIRRLNELENLRQSLLVDIADFRGFVHIRILDLWFIRGMQYLLLLWLSFLLWFDRVIGVQWGSLRINYVPVIFFTSTLLLRQSKFLNKHATALATVILRSVLSWELLSVIIIKSILLFLQGKTLINDLTWLERSSECSRTGCVGCRCCCSSCISRNSRISLGALLVVVVAFKMWEDIVTVVQNNWYFLFLLFRLFLWIWTCNYVDLLQVYAYFIRIWDLGFHLERSPFLFRSRCQVIHLWGLRRLLLLGVFTIKCASLYRFRLKVSFKFWD